METERELSDKSPKNSQVLERYINLSSTVNFSYILLCSWEAFAVTFQFALYNGGPSSMVYGCILVMFGATAVAASLSELASIDPTVGAQYRWSANLSPWAPKFFGLLQGWITIFAWIINCAGPPSIISNIISALATFNYPSYEPKSWHIMLMMWPLIIIPFVMNLWFRQILNTFETIGGVLHFVFFLVSMITLLVLGKGSTNEFVWNNLVSDQSGWNSPGVSWGLGLLTVSFSVLGFDAVLHMSDEVKKVETRVPRSIMIACITNAVMLFAFVLTLLYRLGDLEQVMSSPLPLIPVFYQATGSKAATNFFVVMPALILFVVQFNALASVSRLVWAFARDKGLPFSNFFAYVHPKFKLPINALGLVAVISFLISILYVISTTAFNAIISLQAMGLCVSYVPPIVFILVRKLRGDRPAYGPFKMGRYGVAVNIIAIVYLIFIIIWLPFPQFLPVTGSNFNYAGPLLGVVILGAIADWFISGRKRFQVPVVRKML
ncbi:amino acid transporter [Trichodelitschia bisporula]|uniref:Amino acid transporter n=1 Tax=Trichodelitschia bisporula TaxID=703511 RepID=A0A6G1I986_9PEZI|nr:amino acid transporter [Trichodelitschia bisporula]